MLSTIHLSLQIGNVITPEAARADVLDALESVQVTSSTQNNGFQLKFKVGNDSPIQTELLPSGYFDPISTRVIITVIVSGQQHVLMDGIVMRQELSPSNEPGKTTLTVTGDDLSALMNIAEMPFMRYPAMPEIARIPAILAKYLPFGIVPVAIPPIVFDVPNPLEKMPTQTGTDLEYVRELASKCGYVFFVEPGPSPGMSIAYWGPDLRLPSPQRALNVNMGPETNVDSLSFSLDGKAKNISVLVVTDPVTRRIPIPIPVPNISLLRPPLGSRFPPPGRIKFPKGTAKLTASAAANMGLGIVFRGSADMVTGSGSLNVVRYGDVLRSRMVVGVRGAGLTYDGYYYVNSVTHSLKRGEYKQNFSLSRDGLNSNTSTVQA